MADDDFDKIDDDFANEFDIQDEQPAAAGNTNFDPGSKKSAVASVVRMFVVLAIVGGGGFYAYLTFMKEPAVNPTTPTPLPPATQPHTHTVTPPATAPHPAEIDFNDAMPGHTNENKIDNALSQSKTFEQVQKDLQASSMPAKQQPIPPEVNAILDSISEEMTLNVNQIKNLENTINSLSSAVDQLNKSIGAMDNRVLSLTETVDSLSQDLNRVKKVIVDEDLDLTQTKNIKFNNKQQATPLVSSTPNYTVHAIIPGRAWLRGANGQIITVTEGDKVGDYGTVAVIDANNGLVRTSSGITIR